MNCGIDWEAALDGVCLGIEAETNDKGWNASDDMLIAIHGLVTAQRYQNDAAGGGRENEAIEDLEPTFENEWDYEWPTEFPYEGRFEWKN